MKSTFCFGSKFTTSTGTLAVALPTFTVSCVLPLASGPTSPPAETSPIFEPRVKVASRVASTRSPLASVAVTRSCVAS